MEQKENVIDELYGEPELKENELYNPSTGQLMERDPVTGQFLPGNKAVKRSIGKPHIKDPTKIPLSTRRRQQQKMFMAVLTREMTNENIAQIVRKAIAQAKMGNRYARQWLFDYFAGSPAQVLDVILQGNVKQKVQIEGYHAMLAKVYKENGNKDTGE